MAGLKKSTCLTLPFLPSTGVNHPCYASLLRGCSGYELSPHACKAGALRRRHLPGPSYSGVFTDQSERRIQTPSSPRLQLGHPKQKLGEILQGGCLLLHPAPSPGAVLGARMGPTLDLWILCRQMQGHSILSPVSCSPLPWPSPPWPSPWTSLSSHLPYTLGSTPLSHSL